jgi:uncharacterized Fe-S cluster protein YjdI
MTKPLQTYESPGITVTFDPNLCKHTGVCLRGLPAVFDVARKPWIRPELASATDVAAQVARCPSGALQFRLTDATAETEVIRTGPIEIRFRLQAAQTAGNMTMFEFLVPAGARVPVPHSHDAFDETVYGLAGVTTWVLDGHQVRVGPGDVLFIPRGHVHHFANLEAEDARELSVIVPGLLGPAYFREIAEVVNAAGPPNVERIMEVMRRHGLRPAPPVK